MAIVRPRHFMAALWLAAGLGLAGAAIAAPDNQRAGDYTIHYNALSADALPLVSTRAYGLRHDADQGLVTITVNANAAPGKVGTTVPLTVSGHASTLLGHAVALKVHYVDDPSGHSALVIFNVSGNQTIRFDLDVTPRGAPTTHLQFMHTYKP